MALRDHQTLIREEFARQADAMSTAARFNDAEVLARIREAAQLTAHARVLDVACGPGIVVEALARHVRAATSMDRGGVVVTAGGDGPFDFVSRYFALARGIPEDPVTGGAHCALAPYWAQHWGAVL